MASVASDPDGKKRVLFVAQDGRRKTIRLGKFTLQDARAVARYIQGLVDARIGGVTPARDVVSWLAGVGPKLWEKMVRAGLVEARPGDVASVTLKHHLDNYMARRGDVKPGTQIHWGQTCNCLLTYFGPLRYLANITVGDAEDWQRWLRTGEGRKMRYEGREVGEGLAPATVGKRTRNAIQFFKDAVKRNLIPKNPFEGLKCDKGTNKQRIFFVTREMASRVLDALPDSEWRLIFALSRFGGLRCPSETLSLRWQDINWSTGKMLVHVPKLERIAGKGTRLVPIFPELKPYLNAVWEEAKPGSPFVIRRYRSRNANLRTQLLRYLALAGLPKWPKPFTNLRASMATELAARFPAHVEAEWVGHSEKIAREHYLQVTEADFARALAGDEKAAQNPAQQNEEPGGNEGNSVLEIAKNRQKNDDFRGNSGGCDGMQGKRVGVLGFEPRTSALSELRSSQLSYTP